MPTSTPNIEAAKLYIFDCHAFADYSRHPEEKGSLRTVQLLKKNHWKANHGNIDIPSHLNENLLIQEGMSESQAQLCLLLIKQRMIFAAAVRCGDREEWDDTIQSGWGKHDFIDRYYMLAEWVFGQTPYRTITIQNAVKDLREMRELHLKSKCFFKHNFELAVEKLDKLVSGIITYADIKEHFKNNEKISAVINRLEKGAANNYNPYWMNSSKKLERVMTCLFQSIQNKADINSLLNDKESELSKAIDMKRITILFFEPKDELPTSRGIINRPNGGPR